MHRQASLPNVQMCTDNSMMMWSRSFNQAAAADRHPLQCTQPQFEPKSATLLPNKRGSKPDGGKVHSFLFMWEKKGGDIWTGRAGEGSLVGEVGQLRSEWGWEWDSQVNASDHRGIRECPLSTNVFGPRSINHWVFVYPDKFSFNKWWHQATRILFFFRHAPSSL